MLDDPLESFVFAPYKKHRMRRRAYLLAFGLLLASTLPVFIYLCEGRSPF
jgi:hypothetical protein